MLGCGTVALNTTQLMLKCMYKGLLCEECVARGRYSKSNLKIDLRELKRELIERRFIPASEYEEISKKQVEIIKIINSIGCTCAIQ